MNDSDWAILLLRVATGLTVAAHGYGKIFLGGRLAGTARWFDGIGMRPGRWHARAAAGTEVGAGLLLAAGLMTSLAAAAIVALMAVAAWTVHRHNGFFIVASGWEYNAVLAVNAIVVAVAGHGALSLDHLITRESGFLVGWPGLLIAAGGGVLAAVAHLAAFYRPRVAAPEGAEPSEIR
ncbi:DoxX family protein [Amycolatopsis rhabdoformis]|uniref:DoxX family protein n=1 Tax=Amycolatopsis rhabdoformis TaxID=1448059 RepID=A0ABZ1ICP2_9PSEU|nr:DoxX family protein [Amycolatopsis rhabdoformis]WSE32236.1 DoxX family protein [Amycolatopsis rhabdoformis]